MIQRANVLGCAVDLLGRDQVLERIRLAIAGDRLLHVLTLNPEQVIAARRSTDMQRLLESADLVTADGVGISAALQLQGINGAERITGVQLTNDLARLGISTYLLGGRPGSAELAQERLMTANPGAKLVGAWSGGRADASDDAQSLRRISQSGAVAVLVAFGSPAQLEWIERNREALERSRIRVAIGVGGALDYAAGIAKPVPEWSSRFGVEWLVRLVNEPWRWRRQLVLPVFAVLAGTEAIRMRLKRS